MDKETQKKIAEARLTYIILNWRDNLDTTRMTPQELAQTLMKVLTEEFNWDKLPEGKSPLCQNCDSPILLRQTEFGLTVECKCASSTVDYNPNRRWSSPKG